MKCKLPVLQCINLLPTKTSVEYQSKKLSVYRKLWKKTSDRKTISNQVKMIEPLLSFQNSHFT